jgi:hypothetical protein
MHGQNDLPNEEEGEEEDKPNDGSPLSDTWYTFEEVMAKFKRGKATINRWRRRKKKKLICSKIDGLVIFNKTDLDNFMKMHRG